MPRAKHGGARQGTPGKGYSNRSDLAVNYAPGSAAAGGQAVAPPPAAGPPAADAAAAAPVGPTPDQTPSLLDPTALPGEPLTAGLPSGPGPGPEALPSTQAPGEEARMVARYLPALQQVAQYTGAPDTFKALVRYLQAYR